MRYTVKAPRSGCLRTQIDRLDLRAEGNVAEQALLCVIADSIATGNWRDIRRRWQKAFKAAEEAVRERIR